MRFSGITTRMSLLMKEAFNRRGRLAWSRHYDELKMEHLEPRLLLSGTVEGVVWHDLDKDGHRDSDEPGMVNISQSTYELLLKHDEFSFVSRGKIKAKNKGEIEMYFVEDVD